MISVTYLSYLKNFFSLPFSIPSPFVFIILRWGLIKLTSLVMNLCFSCLSLQVLWDYSNTLLCPQYFLNMDFYSSFTLSPKSFPLFSQFVLINRSVQLNPHYGFDFIILIYHKFPQLTVENMVPLVTYIIKLDLTFILSYIEKRPIL